MEHGRAGQVTSPAVPGLFPYLAQDDERDEGAKGEWKSPSKAQGPERLDAGTLWFSFSLPSASSLSSSALLSSATVPCLLRAAPELSCHFTGPELLRMVLPGTLPSGPSLS